MKKLFKILLILAIIFVVFVAGTVVTLKVMFPPAKLKAMAQDYVKTNFNREVTFEKVSLNLIGVTISDFALSEPATFNDGTFVSAKKLILKVNFKALFDKRIEVQTVGLEDLNINVIKRKNGAFNFDDLLALAGESADEPEEDDKDIKDDEDAMPFEFAADIIYLKNCAVTFTDEQSKSVFGVREVNFKIENFDLVNTFNFSASLTTDISMPDMKISPVKIETSGYANLANMELSKGVFNISSFVTSYKTAKITLDGNVNNFEKPDVVMNGSLTGIDNKLLSEFSAEPLPAFAVPEIKLALSTSSDIEKNFTKINNIKASIGNSNVVINGMADYSKPELVFDIKTAISVSLTEIASIAKEMMDAFKLQGTITGNINAKNGPKMPLVNGTINFKGIGASYEDKDVKDITGVLTIKSLEDISTNTITGKIMNSDFKTSLGYKQLGKTMDIAFYFHLKKFTLDDINFDEFFKADPNAKKEEVKKDAAPQQTKTVEAPRSVPMNIKADVTVDRIENNIFSTDALVLKADIKNFDNKMDRATGTMSFSTKNGEIRDLDKLMQSSVVFKVILSSVHIIQNAFKTLNLDKMSLGSGNVTYSLIDSDFALKNGVVTINKMDINSDLTTVKTSGTINLVNEDLKMKLQSHFGKVTSSGFKPVVINVGGKLSKPTYKLDVLSSASSILGSASKGTAATDAKEASKAAVNSVKDVVGGVADLFKKKK